MAFKRKSYKKRPSKPLRQAKFSKTKRDALVKKMRQVARTVVNRNIETKMSQWSDTDGQEMKHNIIHTVETNFLNTSQGTADPSGTTNGFRIGDEINLRGIKLKFMFEMNERYTDTTYRIMVVKAPRGDAMAQNQLFHGSTNLMMANFNKERYTLIASKMFKITSGLRGATTSQAPGGGPLTDGGLYGSSTDSLLSRKTRMVSLWLPGTKFGRNGRVQYDAGGTVPKFFDYHVFAVAYSNYTTDTDQAIGYNVARCSEYIRTMYYKDA